MIILTLMTTAVTAAPSHHPVVVQSTVAGGTLAQLCTTERDLQLDPCNSYILGVADGLASGRELCPTVDGWTLIAPRVVKKHSREPILAWPLRQFPRTPRSPNRVSVSAPLKRMQHRCDTA
jgi:hypothetical protein